MVDILKGKKSRSNSLIMTCVRAQAALEPSTNHLSLTAIGFFGQKPKLPPPHFFHLILILGEPAEWAVRQEEE